MNSSSDFTISSDWDIIDDVMSQSVTDEKKSEDPPSEDLKEKENVPKGSCVDDIKPEQDEAQEDSSVPDITRPEINNQENSSSSEFDVLDESVEDHQSTLSFSLEYSISSSLGESSHQSLVPEAEADPDSEPQMPREYDTSVPAINVHPYLVAATLFLALIAILIGSMPFGSVQQMKERMSALQSENDELKSLVQSKLENDKLLMALEEQIRSLKDENFKLSDSMKALVAQLEEQTVILRKDKEIKSQDPYRDEIEKLQEQINILQIDNEELQKQLVRTRYGIYSPHSKEPKAKEESKDKPDSKENRENSSEILVEEINELRKKLYAEVEKLKTWKDSVQHLVKKLGNGYAGASAENEKQKFASKESFDHSESSSEKERARRSKPGNKDKKSQWSWKALEKSFKENFGEFRDYDFDVSKVISKYMDKKKVEGVFETVGHYFRKAQEKTKKVLVFDNDVNQEVWNFFGQLRNKWNDLSSKYQNYYAKTPVPSEAEYHKSEFPKDNSDVHDFETEKKFDGYQKQKKSKRASNEKHDRAMHPDVEGFAAPPMVETPDLEKKETSRDDKDNSWVFKRAAHRSQLREEEQEAFTNWFLKRGRDFHYNEDESLKEWFRETYQNGNSDEE